MVTGISGPSLSGKETDLAFETRTKVIVQRRYTEQT